MDDIHIVAEAADDQVAIQQIRAHFPDVIILNVSMPDHNSIDAIRRILTEMPSEKVLALSTHSETHFVQDMLQAGVAGYCEVEKRNPISTNVES